jgi:NTE family protein
MIKRPFVLSGGGARGFAHLGVVKALQERDIFPSAISGTSAGAIAGAFLANGFTPDETSEILAGKLTRKMIGWNSLSLGFMSFKRVGEYIEKNLRYKTFEELPIPLFITATSFVDGRQKIFQKGSIIDALTASCAIPAIFPAFEIENIPYVDGGLANNLPIEPFNLHKKDIIAIHVNPIWDLNEKRGLRAIIERAFNLSFVGTVRQSARHCHMFIEPRDLIKFSLFDLNKADQIIKVGYEYGVNYLLENPDLIKEDALLKKFKASIKQMISS